MPSRGQSLLLFAVVLRSWTLYALAGAGLVHVRPPFVRPALGLVPTLFLIRGILGVPVVLIAAGRHDPYALELRARMVFMIVSSVICAGLGVCYAVGAIGGRPQ